MSDTSMNKRLVLAAVAASALLAGCGAAPGETPAESAPLTQALTANSALRFDASRVQTGGSRPGCP